MCLEPILYNKDDINLTTVFFHIKMQLQQRLMIMFENSI
jgi:hypothetical protein